MATTQLTVDGKRAPENLSFYHDVVNALQPAKEWLIVGPGSAKDELAKHIKDHHPHLLDRIVGVEPADRRDQAFAQRAIERVVASGRFIVTQTMSP